MAKVRKQIYLEKRQNQQLKRLAEARGVSEAEVIRQALDETAIHRQSRTVAIDDTAFEAFLREARARRKRVINGKPYHWNRQDAYEEREAKLAQHWSSGEDS